jgi:hypothetical protein
MKIQEGYDVFKMYIYINSFSSIDQIKNLNVELFYLYAHQ